MCRGLGANEIETQLSRRVHELEERAQAAHERLARARRALKDLAEPGLSPDELPRLVQRVAGIAQRRMAYRRPVIALATTTAHISAVPSMTLKNLASRK